VHAIWSSSDVNDEGKVYQQKLRVTYLPAEGERLDEEDEHAVAMMNNDDNPNQYDTIRQPPGPNGHLPNPNNPFQHSPAPPQQPEQRASTPTQDAVERQPSSQTVVQDPPYVEETSYRSQSPMPPTEAATYVDTTTEPTPEPTTTEPIPEPTDVQDSAPEPAPLPVPAPRQISPAPATASPEPTPAPVIITRENPLNEELYAKYNHAQLEIERLKEQVASLSELRRRPRVPSDAGSTVASDIQTIVEESTIHQEGVPLQVVVIIALGVFITTYLFF